MFGQLLFFRDAVHSGRFLPADPLALPNLYLVIITQGISSSSAQMLTCKFLNFRKGRYERAFFFFSRFAEISRKRKPNAAGPIMFHEVATLVHLIESSKPEVRAGGIHLIGLLEVPLLLEGRPRSRA